MGKGRWASLGHFSYCWKAGNECRGEDGEPYCRIIAGVPKKFFKRAVKRNLLKRRIREAYRKKKGILEGRDVDILFSYNSKEIAGQEEISSEITEILKRLGETCEPCVK